MLKTIFTLLALCWVCASAVQQTDEETKLYQDGKSSVSTSEKLFFGTLSTQSHTIVSYTTSTVFFSCLVAFSTPAMASTAPCMGKRRRRRRRIYVDNGEVGSAKGDFELDPSVAELTDLGREEEAKDSKKFFTVWTKSITTTTLTTFFTNSDTTISLSYYCRAGNIVTPADGC